MVRRVEKSGRSFILYDDSVLSHTDLTWFKPERWPDAISPQGKSGGRGLTLFIEFEGQEWVLRHYYRGGFVGRLLNDQFLWLGLKRTRSFLEWSLLDHLQDLGLPAPFPLAAHVQRRGFIYTADLLMRRIPDVQSLSEHMFQGTMDNSVWREVGACIARFHGERIFHADLNGYNLQLSPSGTVSLVDFDRGRVMAGSGDWQQQNLRRLQRSLTKISNGDSQMFSDGNWGALMAGYQECLSGRDQAGDPGVP